MDWQIVLHLLAAVGAIAGAAKVIIDFSTGSKARLKEDYRFAKEFLHDFTNSEELHPLAIERGFYAIAGTTSIKATDIAHLVSLHEPHQRLKDYVLSRQYVELNSINHRVEFRRKYRKPLVRKSRKVLGLMLYVLTASAAMGPFLSIGFLHFAPKYLLLTLLTLPCFGFYAVDALRMVLKISRAEALVKEQRSHTPRIQVDALGKIAVPLEPKR
ncbi:hypothetical protein NLK61_27345 [Pseudomonas fuscovaginae UPB0736]|uniref:hypothetical protein n=1 Tax=Pseudomonas asplenii TaxID=53407 RepID=UPI00028A2112|nr:hypothetical protein [Pseudomonas fuscovaginae]UUQ64865.1 hypothetical protein NLK61_27345 [Pseudomonas fuscovaginae UPB0736]